MIVTRHQKDNICTTLSRVEQQKQLIRFRNSQTIHFTTTLSSRQRSPFIIQSTRNSLCLAYCWKIPDSNLTPVRWFTEVGKCQSHWSNRIRFYSFILLRFATNIHLHTSIARHSICGTTQCAIRSTAEFQTGQFLSEIFDAAKMEILQ